MVEHILVLADESASYTLGGLRLLERLLRGLEEDFAPGSDASVPTPRVTILWRPTPPAERWPSIDFPVKHLMNGAPRGAVAQGGTTLLLRSNVVFGRRVLPELIRLKKNGSAVSLAPFAMIEGGAPTWRWEELAARVPQVGPSRTDSSHGFVGVVAAQADLVQVEKALFASLGKPLDGLVARYINRPISTRLSRPLARLGMTPNQASVLVLACLGFSAWALVTGTAAGFIMGTLFYKLASVLDGCDGEIARVKFQESRAGAWFDTAVDVFGHQLFVGALGIGLWRRFSGLAPHLAQQYLWEGILSAVGIGLSVWLIARFTERTTGADHFNDFGSSVVDETPLPGWFRRAGYFIAQMMRRDAYALIFVIIAVAGRPEWILHALSIGVAAHFPGIVWLWWKRLGLSVVEEAGTVTEG